MSPPDAVDRLPLGTVLAYGPPILGLAGMLFLVQFFVLNFGTDYLGIAPAVIGTIFAAGRLWDALTDPVFGTWSDRTRTRWGRRRPFMAAAVPLLGLTFVMVFAPPTALSGNALLVWYTVAIFAFYLGLTAYIVPHLALGTELVPGHHDRTRVFAWRAVFFQIGLFVAFASMQVVISAGEGGTNIPAAREMATKLAIGIAIVGCVILVVPVVAIREPVASRASPTAGPVASMGAVLRNPHARLVLAVQFIEMMGTGVLGTLAPYLAKYLLQRDDLVGPLPAAFVLSAVVSVPVWVALSRRFGKKRVWTTAMVGVGVFFGATGLLTAGDVTLAFVLLIGAGFSSGCGFALSPSVLADVIDFDEYETGGRNEGAYAAAWGFAIKAAQALVIFVIGWVLQLAHFTPNEATQPPSAELALRILQGGFPFVAYMVGALLFSRFRLGEAEHAEIQQALQTRRAEGVESRT